MRSRLGVLLAEAARELSRYKSFFLLVFALIWADHLVQRWAPARRGMLAMPEWRWETGQLAQWVFTQLPERLAQLVSDQRTAWVLAGLFVAKQLVSLWPTADMRRMHRRERGRFGLVGALASLTGRQLAWDALAVGASCTLTALWALAAYPAARWGWQAAPGPVWLLLLGAWLLPALPLTMAAFSYSSKIAVLSQGGFAAKLSLFWRLYSSRKILWPSWWFFLARMLVEGLFVALIPLALLWSLPWPWLRIPLAALVATPVYAYLKMLSFKFFLQVYGRFDLVRAEYPDHFGNGRAGQASRYAASEKTAGA